MEKAFDIIGEWFQPSDKSMRLKGRLSFDGTYNGSKLELWGQFEELDSTSSLIDIPLLQGISLDGKMFTLVNCNNTGAKSRNRFQRHEFDISHPIRRYRIDYIIEDCLIDSVDDLVFNELQTNFRHLDTWLEVSGFIKHEFSYEGVSEKYDIVYREPDAIKFKIDDDLSAEFVFRVDAEEGGLYGYETVIKQRVILVIKSKAYRNIESWKDIQYKFQNFLLLANLKDIQTLFTIVRSDNIRMLQDGWQGLPPAKYLKMHSALMNEIPSKNEKEIRRMIFDYQDIQNNFESIITAWFRKSQELDPSFNLFFSSWYAKERVLENSFLTLAQAIETFHAKVFKNQKYIDENCISFKIELLSILDEKYHEWIEAKSKCNEVTYKVIINRMIDSYATESLLKRIGDTSQFSHDVTQTRHWYTHYASGLKNRAKRGADVFPLIENLKSLMVCAILNELGFEKEKIEFLIKEAYSTRILH